MIEAIAGNKPGGIARRLRAGHGAELEIGEGVMETIKSRCTEVESGGRMIDAILTNTLLPELSRQVLNRKLDGSTLVGCASPAGRAALAMTSSKRRGRQWMTAFRACWRKPCRQRLRALMSGASRLSRARAARRNLRPR